MAKALATEGHTKPLPRYGDGLAEPLPYTLVPQYVTPRLLHPPFRAPSGRSSAEAATAERVTRFWCPLRGLPANNGRQDLCLPTHREGHRRREWPPTTAT